MGVHMQFDNHDDRIRYYELLLERDLDALPQFPLPEGYRFVFFSQGDRDNWIDIEMSAKEFMNYEQGLEAWNRYYGNNENALSERMVFIENIKGEKVATATAYYDITNRDKSGDGWLHWVAVRREYQGNGLSKPLISHVLQLMRGLGYTHAKIPTQTTTWLACRIYLDFGFKPLPQNAINNRTGWRIIKALTGHAALESFEPADIEEIITKDSEIENRNCELCDRQRINGEKMIQYRNLREDEICRELFSGFIRHQVVTKCRRRENGEWVIRDDPFVDDWSEEDYRVLIACLRNTVHSGGLVRAAFCEEVLKGFVSVETGLFGGEQRYLDLSAIHVSEDMRGQGIGKVLFEAAKEWARERGAFKLYISAHSAVESQAFYKRMGCVEAQEYNERHVSEEPFDCQLECSVVPQRQTVALKTY